MPYIPQQRREDLFPEFGAAIPRTPGELNFVLADTIKFYLERKDGRPSYANYNEVIGVLEALKLEIYRRLVAPYEDQKIRENGDVF